METTKKIDVRELSIGDYIRVKMCKWDYDDPDTLDAKVLAIESNSVGVGYDNCGIVMSAFVEDLQPIPITTEVLEKLSNGRKRYHAYMVEGIRVRPLGNDEYRVGTERGVIYVKVQYIHELQHAMRLAKIDKEIEL